MYGKDQDRGVYLGIIPVVAAGAPVAVKAISKIGSAIKGLFGGGDSPQTIARKRAGRLAKNPQANEAELRRIASNSRYANVRAIAARAVATLGTGGADPASDAPAEASLPMPLLLGGAALVAVALLRKRGR